MSETRPTSIRIAWILATFGIANLACGTADDLGAKDAGELDGRFVGDDSSHPADAGASLDRAVDDRASSPLAWVEIAASGRYFATDDGAPFIPIGNQPGSGFIDLPDDEIAAHFARMAAFGETIVRLDFDNVFLRETPPRYVGVESKIGVWDSTRVARIDRVIDLADAAGIRLLAVPWVTSPPMWQSWPLNPYSTEQGGPASDPHAFLGSAAARAAFGDRMEWISARWGARGTLFGYDLLNEIDVMLDWNKIHDPEALNGWVLDIGNRVRAFETRTHGRTHARMVSWSGSIPPAEYELLESPALDVAATHPYELFGTSITYGKDTVTSFVEPAIAMHHRIHQMLSGRVQKGRPYMENERHMNHETPLTFHREADHDIAWAELMSGAAGTGVTWLSGVIPAGDAWARYDMVERHENLGGDRRALRDFVSNRVPAAFFLEATDDESTDAMTTDARDAIALMSLRRGRNAIGWLLAKDERCALVATVDEVRDERLRNEVTPIRESALVILIWVKILEGEGVAVDRTEFRDLIVAIESKDATRAAEAIDDAFELLEGIETTSHTLATLAACPRLSPEIRFAMPSRDYEVDWIDDTDASIVRTDTLRGGSGTLVAPSFERHLAFVVREP